MDSALVPADSDAPSSSTITEPVAGRLAAYAARAEGAYAPETLRAIRNDTKSFTAWCLEHGHAALPASRVPVILKRLGAEAGLDPAAVAGLSGHSTRVGAAQDLRRSGASVLDLQAEGGWRDPRMPGLYTARIDAAHGAMARLARIQEGEADGQGDG